MDLKNHQDQNQIVVVVVVLLPITPAKPLQQNTYGGGGDKLRSHQFDSGEGRKKPRNRQDNYLNYAPVG